MGSYSNIVGRKERLPDSFVEALQNFVQSIIGAKEIDAINLMTIKENKEIFSAAFYIANNSIEHALEEIKSQIPSKCPITKEYKKEERNDEEKTNKKS